jgi:hypothetical protein
MKDKRGKNHKENRCKIMGDGTEEKRFLTNKVDQQNDRSVKLGKQ